MKISDATLSSKVTIIFFVFILATVNLSIAQVSIAPTSLFFDQQSRFSSLTISNGGQQAQEIAINTEFGYPTSQDGNITISNDSTLAQTKSIADWVKVFKPFVL